MSTNRSEQFESMVVRTLALADEKVLGLCEATEGGFDGAMRRLVEHSVTEAAHTHHFACGCGRNWKYSVHAPIHKIVGAGCAEYVLQNILAGLECREMGVSRVDVLIEAMRRDDRLRRLVIAMRDTALVIGAHPKFGDTGPLEQARLINELVLCHFE